MQFRRLLCSLCALLALAAIGFTDDLSEFRKQVAGSRTAAQLESIIQRAPETFSSDELEHAEATLESDGHQAAKEALLSSIDATQSLRRAEAGPVADPRAKAKEILSNPIYSDPGAGASRNWLADAIGALAAWVLEQLARLMPSPNAQAPNVGLPLFNGTALITPVLWILGIALAAFLVWVLVKFRFVRLARRKTRGLLEEDEPERTADEWLTEADRLEAQNEHRRAVRCLYLASLVRLDEANVAAFRPGETNWEHLARIESSRRRPKELDFRSPTQRFDVIWYGFQVKGPEDTAYFRSFYTDLQSMLREAKAA